MSASHRSATRFSSSSIQDLALHEEILVNELGFDLSDSSALERAVFTAINEGDQDKLLKIFEKHPSPTIILQFLLTTTYPNRDGFYQHDPSSLSDAAELLGPSLEHLNCIQIACILGDEDLAMDILEFVAKVTEDIDSRKVLYEFMGRVWGNGNTILHLAAFMGMADLVKRLLELGAATGKFNERKYRPVDCAIDEETLMMFETVEETEVDRVKRAESDDATRHSKTISLDGRNSRGLQSKLVKTSSGSIVPMVKKKKSVAFDDTTMLFLLCHDHSNVPDYLNQIKQYIGLPGPAKIDINTTCTPHQGLTPLHVACTHGYEDLAKLLLLEAGACVNVFDHEGWTPLHCAAAEGHLNIVNLLLKCQGRKGEKNDLLGNDCIYVPDGPIYLIPLNEDGETPEDVALESSKTAICGAIQKAKEKYPPLEFEGEQESDDESEESLEPMDVVAPKFERSYSVISRKLHAHEHHAFEKMAEEPKHPIVNEKPLDIAKNANEIPNIASFVTHLEEPLKRDVEVAPQIPGNEPNNDKNDQKLNAKPELKNTSEIPMESDDKLKQSFYSMNGTTSPLAIESENLLPNATANRPLAQECKRTSRVRNSLILACPAAMAETSSGDFRWMEKTASVPQRRLSKSKSDKPATILEIPRSERSEEGTIKPLSVKDRIKHFERAN